MTNFVRKQIPRSHLRLWKDINGQNWVYGKQFGAVTEYTPLPIGYRVKHLQFFNLLTFTPPLNEQNHVLLPKLQSQKNIVCGSL